MLNVEIVEKGNLDRMARKNDAHLLNVQKIITTATAALVNASDQLNGMTAVFTDQAMCDGEQLNPSCFVEAANEMLASSGDIIALLGMAEQELSIRRQYQLQHALPKDMALLCSNENIPIIDKLFSDDANKAIKTVRQTSKSRTTTQAASGKNTLARWLWQVLNGAGVGTVQFSAHSTCAASTLAALSSGVPVDVVLWVAGWSLELTFTWFYRKGTSSKYGASLLDSYLHKLNYNNNKSIFKVQNLVPRQNLVF